MNATCLQGNINGTLLDSTQHAELADKDLVIFQGHFPTVARNDLRIAAIQAIRALRPTGRVRFHQYVIAEETLKTVTSPNNSLLEVAYNLVNGAQGRESWFVHRVNQPTSAGRVENQFDPVNLAELNMACLVSGLNSLGENYAQAFWRAWDEALSIPSHDMTDEIDGFFVDNFNQRPPAMFQNNGATSITDQDYNGNGTADGRADYTAGANAGGRFWAEGHLELKTRHDQRFPGFLLIPNGARFSGDFLDGQGNPPLPLSNAPFYRKFEVALDEHTNLAAGITTGTSGYTFSGGGSTSAYFRHYEIDERFLKLDAANTITGKGCMLMHANGVDRAPIADDYAFARFLSALPLLVERAAPCVQLAGVRPLSLDECLLELGAPTAARTMGTLNENTVTFSLRTANQSVGVARFYWAVFEKGIVVVRGDSPTVGVYPSADAAVTCTLPTPPAGKKWQRINAATYVNPITGRAMRGQDTTLNNGADATTISLKPYHAQFLRLVAA